MPHGTEPLARQIVPLITRHDGIATGGHGFEIVVAQLIRRRPPALRWVGGIEDVDGDAFETVADTVAHDTREDRLAGQVQFDGLALVGEVDRPALGGEAFEDWGELVFAGRQAVQRHDAIRGDVDEAIDVG